MLKSKTILLTIFSLVFLGASSLPAQAQKKDQKEKKVLGAGGEKMNPDLSRVTFIEEKKGGWSTKYRVRDGKGVEWVAKLSKEAQPETASNRLVWAAGY